MIYYKLDIQQHYTFSAEGSLNKLIEKHTLSAP